MDQGGALLALPRRKGETLGISERVIGILSLALQENPDPPQRTTPHPPGKKKKGGWGGGGCVNF